MGLAKVPELALPHLHDPITPLPKLIDFGLGFVHQRFFSFVPLFAFDVFSDVTVVSVVVTSLKMK
jgi:hypothetical protein